MNSANQMARPMEEAMEEASAVPGFANLAGTAVCVTDLPGSSCFVTIVHCFLKKRCPPPPLSPYRRPSRDTHAHTRHSPIPVDVSLCFPLSPAHSRTSFKIRGAETDKSERLSAPITSCFNTARPAAPKGIMGFNLRAACARVIRKRQGFLNQRWKIIMRTAWMARGDG